MKILCIGHSSWDMTVPVDDYPIENTKYRFSEKYSAGGGPASNAAYLLGKWGIETVIATTIGSDDFGTKIKKEFQDIKVNTEYIETNYEKETSFSFILINKKNGSRTVFNVATEHPALKKLNYDFTPDIIFTDGHDYGATQNAISKYQNAISVIDAGRITPELLELCKYIKYIVCSKGFAETVTGMKFDFNNPQSLVNIYTKLQNKYPNSNLTITLEEHGCLYTSGNEIKIMPGLKLTPVDTTGAGDSFWGGTLSAYLSLEKPIESLTWEEIHHCAVCGNATAALCVQKRGGIPAIPTKEEVEQMLAEKLS